MVKKSGKRGAMNEAENGLKPAEILENSGFTGDKVLSVAPMMDWRHGNMKAMLVKAFSRLD